MEPSFGDRLLLLLGRLVRFSTALLHEVVFFPTTLAWHLALLFFATVIGAANGLVATGLGMLLALPPAVGPLWGVAAGLFALAYYLRLHHTKYPEGPS